MPNDTPGGTPGKMTYDELLNLIETSEQWLDGCPVVTAPVLADELDVTRQAIQYRLNKLVEQDEIARHSPHEGCVLYWRKYV